MKKFVSFIILLGIAIFISGCDTSETVTIYTTVYPIEYLTNTLYGNHSTVSSIYPSDADTSSYSLSDKEIETYAKGTIFIYNGTSNEKQTANTLVSKNKKLKIIDAAYGLSYTYGVEELWLSPSNMLMLASIIKDGLEEQIGSKYINVEIDDNYDELEETLSVMDAQIRKAAKDAVSRGESTIIASSSVFKYLENYGFTVISLEDYDETSISNLKSSFKEGKYKYILTRDDEEENNLVKTLKTDAGATTIEVKMMTTLSEEDQKSNNTYITIMNEYISNLKTITNY